MIVFDGHIGLGKMETLNILYNTGYFCTSDDDRKLFEAVLPGSTPLVGSVALSGVDEDGRLEYYEEYGRQDLLDAGFGNLKTTDFVEVWPANEIHGWMIDPSSPIRRQIPLENSVCLANYLFGIIANCTMREEARSAQSALAYLWCTVDPAYWLGVDRSIVPELSRVLN